MQRINIYVDYSGFKFKVYKNNDKFEICYNEELVLVIVSNFNDIFELISSMYKRIGWIQDISTMSLVILVLMESYKHEKSNDIEWIESKIKELLGNF